MKRLVAIFVNISVLAAASFSPVYALSENQLEALQLLMDDASSKSGAPGSSLSIIAGDVIQCLFPDRATVQNEYLPPKIRSMS